MNVLNVAQVAGLGSAQAAEVRIGRQHLRLQLLLGAEHQRLDEDLRPELSRCRRLVEGSAHVIGEALLAFFDAHPALVAAPVVLVGESYGGVRATRMLQLLLRYPVEGAAGGDDLPARPCPRGRQELHDGVDLDTEEGVGGAPGPRRPRPP